jgi:hypothetical protein
MEGWESFDGMLALKGVDPQGWTLRRLLNAAEYHVISSAGDDKERARIIAKLYAPMSSQRAREATRAQPDRVGPWTRPVYSGVPDATGSVPASTRREETPVPQGMPAPEGTNAGRSLADILALAALQDG